MAVAAVLRRRLVDCTTRASSFSLDTTTLLLAGVQTLMPVGAAMRSFLFASNFSGCCWLISVPFLWAPCARLYGAMASSTPWGFRWGLNMAASAGVLTSDVKATLQDRIDRGACPVFG